MSDESEAAWARRRAQELERAAAITSGDTAARQEGETKLSRLQTRLEAIESAFGVRADGADKPRATIVSDESGDVIVRWTRINAELIGWFGGSVGEHQTASVDDAFDATYGFLMERRRKLHRTGA
jgi:hypothetical protein